MESGQIAKIKALEERLGGSLVAVSQQLLGDQDEVGLPESSSSPAVSSAGHSLSW